MKTINSRLYEFIVEDQGITPLKFAQSIGVKESKISEIIIGSVSTIDKDTLAKIKKRYPQLNPDWLIKGVGEKIIAPAVKKKTRDHYVHMIPGEEAEAMKPIAARIVKLRESHGYRITDVAKELNIGISGYSALEQGYAKISIPKMIKLKEFYDVTWEYLLDGKIMDPEKVKSLEEANKIIKSQKETIELLRQNNDLLTEKIKKKK